MFTGAVPLRRVPCGCVSTPLCNSAHPTGASPGQIVLMLDETPPHTRVLLIPLSVSLLPSEVTVSVLQHDAGLRRRNGDFKTDWQDEVFCFFEEEDKNEGGNNISAAVTDSHCLHTRLVHPCVCGDACGSERDRERFMRAGRSRHGAKSENKNTIKCATAHGFENRRRGNR